MRMTYRTAYSLGLDAANLQMRRAGRTAWNEDDATLPHAPGTCTSHSAWSIRAYARNSLALEPHGL